MHGNLELTKPDNCSWPLLTLYYIFSNIEINLVKKYILEIIN